MCRILTESGGSVLSDVTRDKHLVVSFSGGRTSAYMLKMLLDSEGRNNVTAIFANTGAEHPKTLDFVNECSIRWNVPVVWVEAKVIFGKRESSTYNVVDYKSASRNGEPFEDVIRKYGLPNVKYLHCTRELKERPITKYIKDHWSKDEYELVIGIRSDEIDRVNLVEKVRRNIIYPLADLGITKKVVDDYWSNQPFDLGIPDHYGNCVTCFKKTNRKLYSIAMDDDNWFNMMGRWGVKYRYTNSTHVNGRMIFRGNRNADAIVDASNEADFKRIHLWNIEDDFDPTFDVGGGCGESCEVFSDSN